MTDAEILEAAAAIIEKRKAHALECQQAELTRLYKRYARGKNFDTYDLGKPKKLEQDEALLVAVLVRNKYEPELESVGGRWHGTAFCKYAVREGAICRADSRRDLLLGLWASVSEQREPILLTEAHLQGALIQQHLRELRESMADEGE